MNTINLKVYDDETGRFVESGETMSIYQLCRSLTMQNFADIFDNYLNLGGKSKYEGLQLGKLLQRSHRSIQADIVMFCLGILEGLAEQEYYDGRNEYALKLAKSIVRLWNEGSL